MPTKPLNTSISEALMQFFAASDTEAEVVPEYLVEVIRDEVAPAIQNYKAGQIDHNEVGKVIWDSSIYVLRDMKDEEVKKYSSMMYGAIVAHGHLDQ